ncbi:HeH/LEM domain-containing protein [bacterium 210820-DFI.6.37]|nr:HeH/LEM domain-containing protein [bacterium 210820-DFI.6.37]
MIRIIKGAYGLPQGRVVKAITKKDGPITIAPEREAELVASGIAEYVDAPDTKEEDVAVENMTVQQLKTVADQLGIKYPGNIKKDDLIQLIEDAGEDEAETEPEEDTPSIDPTQAVR